MSSALFEPVHSSTTSAPPSRNSWPRSGVSLTALVCRRTALVVCSGRTTSSAPARRGGRPLLLVLGRDDHMPGLGEELERHQRQDADRAGADHEHGLAGGDGRPLRGVDRTGERLEQHGDLVRDGVGDREQLRAMGHHRAGPAAARVGAVARLQTGFQVTDRDAVTTVRRAGGAVRTQRFAASRAREHAAHHDAGARRQVITVLRELTDDLVAGHERRRHERREVEGRPAGDRGEIAAADAGEERLHRRPAVVAVRRLGVLDVHEPQRGERSRASRAPSSPRCARRCIWGRSGSIPAQGWS